MLSLLSLSARRRAASLATSAALGAAAALLMAARPARAGGSENYLALGDSYAYGYQTITLTPPASYGSGASVVPLGGGSTGDQGYVSLFASYLGTRDGATVNVLNLARPGETSTSFTNSSISPTQTIIGGQIQPVNFNTNYTSGSYAQSQAALLASTLSDSTYAANVKYVTFQLGGNDIIDLVNSSAFQAESPTQQQIDLNTAFTTLATNDAAILTGVRSLLPNAQIFLLDYPNAFAGIAGSPLGATFAPLVQQSVGIYQNIAALPSVNARFVDLSTPFSGHEADWTWINTTDVGGPDYHPNATGYQQIAGALVSAAAPEPGTLPLLALPLLGGASLGVARRRQRNGA